MGALLRFSESLGQRECDESDYTRQAFYPLTLTVGPGSIGGMLFRSVLISVAIFLSYRSPNGSAAVPGRGQQKNPREALF